MRKRLVALLLALGVLAGSAGSAEATRTKIGYKEFQFAGHGDAYVALSLYAVDPAQGTAFALGYMNVFDSAPINIDRIYLQELIVQVQHPSGNIENAQALGGATTGDPANNRDAPFVQNSPQAYFETLGTGCLHPQAEPGGIKDNDYAWVRATYRIYWMDGTNTSLLVHSSVHALFDAPTDCD